MQIDLDAEIEDFLAGYPAEIQEMALTLREIVLELAADAIEQLDLPAKMLAYGFARTYKDLICVIMPLKEGVNLGFPRGVDLPDPAGLLTGSGKRARHVRISSPEEARSPEVKALLLASIAQLRAS